MQYQELIHIYEIILTYYIYIKGYCNPSSGSNPPAINTILYATLVPKPSTAS